MLDVEKEAKGWRRTETLGVVLAVKSRATVDSVTVLRERVVGFKLLCRLREGEVCEVLLEADGK